MAQPVNNKVCACALRMTMHGRTAWRGGRWLQAEEWGSFSVNQCNGHPNSVCSVTLMSWALPAEAAWLEA
eukprot:1161564-Pelagomonas_calceolata.AAC.4